VLYLYSMTLKLPITNSSTFVPFVNYTSLPVLYRDSVVPEAYRGIVVGFVKIINKNATLGLYESHPPNVQMPRACPAPTISVWPWESSNWICTRNSNATRRRARLRSRNAYRCR